MRFLITDHETADTIVSEAPEELRAVVSIFSPPASHTVRRGLARGVPCSGFEDFAFHKIALSFDDSSDSDNPLAPTMDDMREFMAWAETVPLNPDHVILFHCHTGISRSTSFALAFLAAKLGPGAEQDAMEYVLTVRPCASFNELIVALADEHLGRNGKLQEVVATWTASQKSVFVY